MAVRYHRTARPARHTTRGSGHSDSWGAKRSIFGIHDIRAESGRSTGHAGKNCCAEGRSATFKPKANIPAESRLLRLFAARASD